MKRKIISTFLNLILLSGVFFISGVYSDSGEGQETNNGLGKYDIDFQFRNISGMKLNDVPTMFPNIIPNTNEIVYINRGDGYTVYKKDINSFGNGEKITTNGVSNGYGKIVSPSGDFLVYPNGYDGRTLYKKYLNQYGNGTKVTENGGYNVQISNDESFILYIDPITRKVYRKNLNNTYDDGLIVDVIVGEIALSPNMDSVIYGNNLDWGILYKKMLGTPGDGVPFTTIRGHNIKFSDDGNFVYFVDENYLIHKKGINDSGNGTIITDVYILPDFVGTINKYSIINNGECIIYSDASDLYKLYKKNILNNSPAEKITDVPMYEVEFSANTNDILYSAPHDNLKLYKINLDNPKGYFMNDGIYNAPEINAGKDLSSIRIDINSTIPNGTNYNFYLANQNNTASYKLIDNQLLDGNTVIDLNDLFGTTTDKLYYKIELIGDLSDNTKTPIIHSVEFIDPDAIINPPTNLTQEIQSPSLDKQSVEVSEKIGKYQSGSGVIISSYVDNNTGNQVRLAVEMFEFLDTYPIGSNNPISIFYSNYSSNSGNLSVTIPYLGAGKYNWRVRTETIDGKYSDWVEFGTSAPWEYDYELYEGFEPYPYGFNFINASPDHTLLTGELKGNWLLGYEKVNGTKWEIMDMVFPVSSFVSEKAYLRAFDAFGLNETNPSIFALGNCFGLSLSALTQYKYPEVLKKNFPKFSANIGNGTIRHNINVGVENNKFIGLDDNIKTILALQLYYREPNFNAKIMESYDNDSPIDVLNKIKNNPNKNYILSFWGRRNCNTFGLFCEEVAHAVVPYKVEGNKIYVWDNVIPYPYRQVDENNLRYAYNSYVEVDIDKNTFNVPLYNIEKFDTIGLGDMEDAYTNSSSPIGFNGTDILYILDGNSDILLVDNEGRRTGYLDGGIYREIPGAHIMITPSDLGILENNRKEIYIAKKIPDLQLEIKGRESESYNLIVAGGNYFTKLTGINTSEGQIDKYIFDREFLQIDFDDNKVGNYNLEIEDFELKQNYLVYLESVDIIKEAQRYEIDWEKMGVVHKLDKNGNGKFESNEEPKVKDKKGEDDQGENENGNGNNNNNGGNGKNSQGGKGNNNQQ